MVTLLNTITSEQGEVFALSHGRRILLAHCRPEISIYEEDMPVPDFRKPGDRVKQRRFTIGLHGEDTDDTHNPKYEIERYEITADIRMNDGILERFYFHNISPMEHEFALNVTAEQMRKLSLIAGI